MSKPLAGGWEIDRPVYCDAVPNQDRTAAPADEVAKFMAAKLFTCHPLSARITASQCETNRKNGLYLCGKCEQVLMAAEVKPAPKKKTLQRAAAIGTKSPWREQLYDRAALAEHEATFIGVDLASGPDQAVVTVVTVSPAGQVRSGQVRSGQVRSGQVRSGQVRSGQVRSGQVSRGDRQRHPPDPADNGREASLRCSDHRPGRNSNLLSP